MTMLKAKLRKIGNSLGVIIPNDVITEARLVLNNVITLEVLMGKEVITKGNVITQNPPKVITSPSPVITPKKVIFDTRWCKKHKVMKGSCKCK